MKFIKIIFGILLIVTACSQSNQTDKISDWWTFEDRQHIITEFNRTTNELRLEIEIITNDQWVFKEDSGRWSIAEIVEHLEMQNQLHFREISTVSNAPQHLQYRIITEGNDQFFSDYATDPTPGQAQWFLEPLGRFCTKAEGKDAFFRARSKLLEFVVQTKIDLRKQFTFRTPVEGMDISELRIRQVHDLHQLLLTGIAHTDPHLNQIRNIKKHTDYSQNQ